MNLDHCGQWPALGFEWVWRTSLGATVLIVLVFLTVILFRKRMTPGWRYLLWLLVPLRLMLPAAPASPFGIFNVSTFPHLNPKPGNQPIIREPSASLAPSHLSQSAAVPIQPARAPRSVSPPQFWKRVDPGMALGWLWLSGTATFLVLVLGRHWRFAMKVKQAKLVTDERVRSIFTSSQTMLGIRRHIDLIETDHLRTPAVFGIFRPRLLLPRCLLQSLDNRELRMIFLHELMHIKHGDLRLNWLLILEQAAHWFNPAGVQTIAG